MLFLKDDINGRAALAPMAGVADRAMRELCREAGAAYCTGELVSSKGLSLGDRKSAAFLEFGEKERPFGIQLFGCEPSVLAEAAVTAASHRPDFIDINMGCPAPKVAVSGGGGAALMKDPALCGRIVRAVTDAVDLPVTVKIRTGWDGGNVNAVEVARICEDSGAAAVTVHGRTRAQMYAPGIDLDTIAAVKRAVKIPVIGNGGIETPEDAAEMYRRTGCDMVMIGRAAMGAPWIFRKINAYLENGTVLPDPPLTERLLLLRRQVDLMIRYKGEKIAFLEARKHTAWYMRGLCGAAELRRMAGGINSLSSLDLVCERALKMNPE